MRKEDILLYPFRYRHYLCRGTNPCPVKHTIESHSILDKYLYADISTPIIEIPLIFADALRLALKFPTGECAQIVAPLVYGREVPASTTLSIFREAFLNTDIRNHKLTKVVTKTGEKYYVGPGMIFGKDMVPYLLYTVTIDKSSSEKDTFRRYKALSFNIRVAPCVFTNKDDMIKKGIISTIIPTLLSLNVGYTSNFVCGEQAVPKILIEDLSKWIVSPGKITDTANFNEDMGEFLAREDIINDVIKCL